MVGLFKARPLAVIGLLVPLLAAHGWALASEPAPAGASVRPEPILPAEMFSPALLGVYRKVSRLDSEIIRYAERYGVDVTLARAVCMYESGGNPNLTSAVGARGYFQVMPSTFRLLRVESNIEAGIKYLGQLVHRFGREDYALAAYNGGPSRVARGRPMPLESLQYVMGVSAYRSVLKAYGPSVRANARQLDLATVQPGENWWSLSERLDLPVVQLRLHNPFLAARRLRPGYLVAYPSAPRDDVFDRSGDRPRYRTRLGDNYLNVAFILGVSIELLRSANHLWRLEPLLPGTELEIPVDPGGTFTEYTVQDGDRVAAVASRLDADPWTIVRDNAIWNEHLTPGIVLRIRRRPPPPPLPAFVTHVVRRGETLSGLAARYHTTVARLQALNRLGARTLVKVGQRLRVPAP